VKGMTGLPSEKQTLGKLPYLQTVPLINEQSIASWHKKLESVEGDERAVPEILKHGPAMIRESSNGL
jgi:hypothetical protein